MGAHGDERLARVEMVNLANPECAPGRRIPRSIRPTRGAFMDMEFGLGCFAFDLQPRYFREFSEQRPLTTSAYAEAVSTALGSIPGVVVTDLREPSAFSSGLDFVSEVIWPQEPHGEEPDPYDDPWPTVDPFNFSVSFEVTVPVQFQRDRDITRADSPATTFYVVVSGNAFGPAAVVWNKPAEGQESIGPSAVAAVREYLDDEFRRRQDQVAPLSFSCIGPSPMHLNGFLEWAPLDPVYADGDYGWWRGDLHPVRGSYDDLSLTAAGFAGRDGAIDVISRDLAEEASVYYRLVRMVTSVGRSEVELVKRIEHILGEVDEKDRSRWRRWGASTVALDALRLKGRIALGAREADRMTLDQYAEGDGPLRPLVEGKVGELSSAMNPATLEVVDLLERRRDSRMERAAVVLAGFLGAAVGAGLTALLT